MALKETLVRLKKQQENAVSFEADKPRLRDEWITAVNSLVNEFKAFLSPFEADLAVQVREVSLTEDMLGTYTVPAVTVEAGPAKIELIPVGRVVVGATGRVDLARQGYPKTSNRILILRLQDENADLNRWALKMPVELGAVRSSGFGIQTRQFDFNFVPFDRENVEKAIDFLLSL